MPKDAKSLLLIVLPILATVILSYILQAVVVSNQEEFTKWLSSFGPFVIFVYIILQTIALIFAPIGGYFLIIAMIALFGPAIAITLAYFVYVPCFMVNFYLSKRYGRPFAERIVGKATLRKMDEFIEDMGIEILIILRLFQTGNFDFLSYAFGLTKITFKTFAIVNILAGIPAAFVLYLVYSKTESLTQGVVVGYIISAVFVGLSILLHFIMRKRKKRNDR